MKTSITFIVLLTVVTIQNNMQAQQWETPIIEGYGKIVHYEQAQNQPDPSKEYKIMFHIKDGKEREGVNEGLWKVARLINLMGSYKVPQGHLKIVLIISGTATPLVLQDETYQKHNHKPNPNLDLIEKLIQYDAKILVCGQALAKHNYDVDTDLNPHIGVTVSALTAIPFFEMEGYFSMF